MAIIVILLAGSTEVVKDKADSMMSAMFTGQRFWLKDDLYVEEISKMSYYIEGIVKGSFVNPSHEEYMIVVRRPVNEPSHAEGFYQAYVAVFDEATHRRISETHVFVADEGYITLFSTKEMDYVFFAGGTTYQGWTTWNGGLWKAGPEWKRLWPDKDEYWQDRYPKADSEGLTIMERKVTPEAFEQTIPDYEWEYSYALKWDAEKGGFVKTSVAPE